MNKHVKVGIFFVVGLVDTARGIRLRGGPAVLRERLQAQDLFCSRSDELREGNPVKLEGFAVGKISKIRLADRKIEVEMTVAKDSGIKTDSVATIRLTSLLGTSYINLSFGSPGSPVAPPGSVLPSEEPADINDILVKVDSAVGSIRVALERVRRAG